MDYKDDNTWLMLGDYLDKIAQIAPMSREIYGADESNKPNDHCNWERLIPTLTSPFGWVENDEHFRSRIKARLA